MKNTLVRAFVLSLTVAGFGAATVASQARTTKVAAQVAPQSVGSPLPPCPTDGSAGYCGF